MMEIEFKIVRLILSNNRYEAKKKQNSGCSRVQYSMYCVQMVFSRFFQWKKIKLLMNIVIEVLSFSAYLRRPIHWPVGCRNLSWICAAIFVCVCICVRSLANSRDASEYRVALQCGFLMGSHKEEEKSTFDFFFSVVAFSVLLIWLCSDVFVQLICNNLLELLTALFLLFTWTKLSGN